MNSPRTWIVVAALVGLLICPAWSLAQQGDTAQPATETEVEAETTAEAKSTEPAPDATEPAAESSEPVANASPEKINVAQAVICQDIIDRAPIGASDVIPAGTERIYCYTRIEGAETATEITHNWYYQGALKASVTLPVRNANWRTWSSKTLLPEWKGEWMVEVMSEAGTPLDSIIFFVK